jgi:hypothetical protein
MSSRDAATKSITFSEWVRALIDYAQMDGANGCPPGRSRQTDEAARWLRRAYREALNGSNEEG